MEKERKLTIVVCHRLTITLLTHYLYPSPTRGQASTDKYLRTKNLTKCFPFGCTTVTETPEACWIC